MALDVSSVLRGRLDGKTNFATRDFVITSGVTVTAGDFVYFDGSGRITNSSIAGQRLVGMAVEGGVGNSGGTVKARICVDPQMLYLLKNDNIGATFSASSVGVNFDLTGATGAQLVDTSQSGTTGQLIAVEYNPQIDPVKADTTYGLFMIAENVFNTGSGAQ